MISIGWIVHMYHIEAHTKKSDLVPLQKEPLLYFAGVEIADHLAITTRLKACGQPNFEHDAPS